MTREIKKINFGAVPDDLEGQGASQPLSAPSRPVIEAKENVVQISVRAPRSTINRLRHLCETERYSYGDMLKRLLDKYEGSGA